MRIPDVFPLVYDYDSDQDEREFKYKVLRTILDTGLVDKNEFITVIENHKEVVAAVASAMDSEEEWVEELIVDMYNYPEIMQEYGALLDEYRYEVLDDSAHDSDEDDGSESDEDDTETDTTSNSEDEKVIEVEEDDVMLPEEFVAELEKIKVEVRTNNAFASISIGISLFNLSFSIINLVLSLKK